MKVFYTKTYNVWNDNTRMHDIVAQAAKKLDYDEVSLFKFNDTYDSDDELHVRMQGITAAVSSDSIVIFQYPSMVSARYDSFVMEHLKNTCGAKVAVFVEDLGSRIAPSDYKQLSDEIDLFNKAYSISGNKIRYIRLLRYYHRNTCTYTKACFKWIYHKTIFIFPVCCCAHGKSCFL